MKTSKCREQSCQAEIVWLKTKKGKLCPVDVESLSEDDVAALENKEDVEYRYGDHVSHFKTCKTPGRFSSENKSTDKEKTKS